MKIAEDLPNAAVLIQELLHFRVKIDLVTATTWWQRWTPWASMGLCWQYIRVKGLGLIDAFCCPHFDSETTGKKRDQDFRDMVQRYGGTGIAIENNCALEVVGQVVGT